MESWLKDYARHRDEQAAELEMSPATRRMLLAEVARHYGHQEPPRNGPDRTPTKPTGLRGLR